MINLFSNSVFVCRWTKGYDGGTAEYITQDTVCYKCGNCIKFVTDDGRENAFEPPNGGLGVVAVHVVRSQFAYVERKQQPSITVKKYPYFDTIVVLEGGFLFKFQFVNGEW